MCDKCAELDDKVEHYQRIASRITDQAMLAGIKELIERAKASEGGAPPRTAVRAQKLVSTSPKWAA